MSAPGTALPRPAHGGAARGGWLGLLRARLATRRGEAAEVRDALCLVVSESGWRATLFPGDGAPPVVTGEAAAPEEAPATTPEVLRRAIRAITPAQRERLDSVRVVVDDEAFGLADNRVLRLRSIDPVAVRHAGTQELGSKGAVYGFLPLGASSKDEVPRGAYAFASAERVGDYLAAMDSLAPRLVGLVPALLPRLEAAGPGPFAALELRAEGGTLVLADPDSGALAFRRLTVGTRTLAGALAGATGVTLREAAEGLARRRCMPDAALDAALPPTLAAHALAAPLATLRAALLESMDYFVFQRLAGAPERLLLSGEVARVRGLAEWLGALLETEVVTAPELALLPGPRAGEGINFLESTPRQLLRVGRSGYEFVDGRFRVEQRQAGGPAGGTARGGLRGLATQPLSLATLRALPATVAAALSGAGAASRARTGAPRAGHAPAPPGTSAGGRASLRLPALPSVPVLAAGALAGLALLAGVLPLPWGTPSAAGSGALAVLSEQLAADAALRRELARREAPPPAPPDVPLPWSGRLLALARLVPDPVRLTALSVLPDPAQPRHDGRLSVEGSLPASAGALAEITAVTDRLAADPGFGMGLAAPSLEGVTVAHNAGVDMAGGTGAGATRDPGVDAVEFTLSAPVLPPSLGHP